MTPPTKIALAMLSIACIGTALIAVGLGINGKLAALGTGIALVAIALSVFSAVWRG